jgi:hypothetical protein
VGVGAAPSAMNRLRSLMMSSGSGILPWMSFTTREMYSSRDTPAPLAAVRGCRSIRLRHISLEAEEK